MTTGRLLLALAIVAGGPLSAGCSPLSHVARDEFSTAYTCPRSDIAVTARPDIAAHTLLPAEPPPEEVARDPERLRLWETKQRQTEAEQDRRTVYDVEGCGHQQRYACENSDFFEEFPVCLVPPPASVPPGARRSDL